jgi:hypothetical protein
MRLSAGSKVYSNFVYNKLVFTALTQYRTEKPTASDTVILLDTSQRTHSHGLFRRKDHSRNSMNQPTSQEWLLFFNVYGLGLLTLKYTWINR